MAPTELATMSVEQLTQQREQLENDLVEHRRGYGASRTREAAEQRIHADFEAAESALAELIEKGRYAAITSTLTLNSRWGGWGSRREPAVARHVARVGRASGLTRLRRRDRALHR